MIESGVSNMNASFISHALATLNEEQDTWTTLYEKCQRIGLIADNNISIDPRYRVFYFDSNSEMLYITYYDGTMILYENGDEIPEGYTVMTINNKLYLNKISNNSVPCTINGHHYRIHAAISYDKIVGFYFANRDPNKYLEELENY